MSILARWYGDGLADETVLTEGTAGTGDAPFELVSDNQFTVDATGARPPRIRMDQDTATVAQIIWRTATLGSLTNFAVRGYVEFTAFPSAGTPLLTAYGSNDSAQRWRVDVKAAGELRLRDAANVELDVSAAPMPLNTEIRIDVVISGTSATVTAHTGDDDTGPLTTLTGTVGATTDSIRYGNPQSVPIWPTLWWDDLAVSDTAAPIGPRVRHGSAAWTAEVTMAGTPQVEQNQGASWAMGVSMTATPRARRYASAAWSIGMGMGIDTGAPPISALTGGEWRPATVRHLAAGTWQPT